MKSLIFIYGQDGYRGLEKLKETVSGLKALHKGLLVKEIDLQDSKALHNLNQEFRQDSLFGQKKLFVIRNAFTNTALQDYLKGHGLPPAKQTFLIVYEDGEPRVTDGLFRFLKAQAEVYHYPHLTGRELAEWLIREAKKFRGDIDRPAANYLAKYFGPDTWALSSQLKKLVAFKKGATINLKDVMGFAPPKVDTVIFRVLDLLSEGRKAEALKLLSEHLAKGTSPSWLLAMIVYQLRNLLLAKEVQEGRLSVQKASLHPYVLNKLSLFTRPLSKEEIKKSLRRVFEVDRDIKIGRVQPEMALELLVSEIGN